MRNALVVRSMDLIWTLDLGVKGLLPCFRGLKFRTVDTILLAMDCRTRTSTPRQFRVALTSTASLYLRLVRYLRVKYYDLVSRTWGLPGRRSEDDLASLRLPLQDWVVVLEDDLEVLRPRISHSALVAVKKSAVLNDRERIMLREITYTRVCDDAWRLYLHHSLYKLDAA